MAPKLGKGYLSVKLWWRNPWLSSATTCRGFLARPSADGPVGRCDRSGAGFAAYARVLHPVEVEDRPTTSGSAAAQAAGTQVHALAQ